MTKHRVSNWVDRGEPAQPHLARVLLRFLELSPERDAAALAEYSETIIAFVAADGSEVELADYLAELERGLGREVSPGRLRRYVAVALWHIAKAALLRDALSRQV
jgi:predicted fused transcriptional regulator/phosphomethylpyrimidine kinase